MFFQKKEEKSDAVFTYLMLDHGGVLDGSLSYERPTHDDLLLDTIKIDRDANPKATVLYQIIKNGKSVIQQLNQLVDSHRYRLVFHSKNKEADQMRLLKQLCHACQRVDLSFPVIHAMAVCDPVAFKGIDSSTPKIIKNRPHQIVMAGYGKELPGKSCVRQALAILLNIDNQSRPQHIILDDGMTVIDQAKKEGYRVYAIGDGKNRVSLSTAIQSIYNEYAFCIPHR
jgi:hypothetical protein